MRTFKRVHSFGLDADARTESLAFSRDGRLMLAACSDGRARLFDSASRAEVCPSPLLCFGCCADLAQCTQPNGWPEAHSCLHLSHRRQLMSTTGLWPQTELRIC